jgi:hypothetical protein
LQPAPRNRGAILSIDCTQSGNTEMTATALDAYVRSALTMQGYQFDEAQIAGIIVQFARIEGIARGFLDIALPLAAEAAPVFQP